MVDQLPWQLWVYDDVGIVVAFDPGAGSIDLVEVYFAEVPTGGVVPARRFAGTVTIGKAAVSAKSSMDSSGDAVGEAGGVYESRNPAEGWNFSLGPLYVTLGAPTAAGEAGAESPEPIEDRLIKTLSIGFGFDDPVSQVDVVNPLEVQSSWAPAQLYGDRRWPQIRSTRILAAGRSPMRKVSPPVSSVSTSAASSRPTV
jgi:hypothetical protein